MFDNKYEGRKIFVTGHTGFKGSWLCAWLLTLGAVPVGYSLDIPTTPSNFEALNLADKMEDNRGDVRDLSTLKKIIEQTRPEIVFHLAAQPLVRKSYDKPVETFQTNMLGVLNILEACRNIKSVKAIVIITSDKCYRNEEWIWGYREEDRLGGYDPYSASKGCAEIIAHSYFKSFYSAGPACATVRAGNVIGGGDWAQDRIVPDCVRAWSNRMPVEIRNPGATRPWQHVLEPLSGYLELGARLFVNESFCRGQSYNFGPGPEVTETVGELVKDLPRYWPGFKIVYPAGNNVDNKSAKGESGLLKLCCDKALAHLNWRAVLKFEETIRYTAEWYSRYYAEKPVPDMWQFSTGQISAYTNSALERGLKWSMA